MSPAVAIPLVLLGISAAILVAVMLFMYLIVPAFKGIGWLITQVFTFLGNELGDILRVVGAVITTVVFVPLTIGSIIFGRWSAASHYGRAIQGEIGALGRCAYRIVIGHPARLFCLTPLTDGIENRLPQVVAGAPGADKPRGGARAGQFDGYKIVGSLPGGGSGGRLFVAEPDEIKRAGFERAGQRGVGQVVIKTFSLKDGSSLPQIVRESRALDAAKRLGLVLEHELTDERFYYVTRYVAGDSLTLVTQRLHAAAGPAGLGTDQLRTALSYVADLLLTLDTYHRGGLWHKDVKPDNIVVDRRAAHLVDFGLVSSLRSAMTLTTHGTEYFRDPEMVRMALKGVKVHQVNGAKFDVFGAGAVMFSVVENSFPAHGGLSQISLRCPEAVRWIVRRAMTDYDKRYEAAADMLADVQFVREAADPFAVRPADLPSVRGYGVPAASEPEAAHVAFTPPPVPEPEVVAAASPVPPRMDPPPAPGRRHKPSIRMAGWWSGRYEVDGVRDQPVRGADRAQGPARSNNAEAIRISLEEARRAMRPAAEQLEHARSRMQAARHRAQERMAARRHRPRAKDFNTGFNPGVGAALFLFLAVCVGAAMMMLVWGRSSGQQLASVDQSGRGVLPPSPPQSPVIDVSSRAEPGERFRTELKSGRAPAALPRVTGRVLVLSDLQPPLPKDAEAQVNAALERLRGSGLTLAGITAGPTGSEEELSAQIEMESSVRAARGLVPLDSADAGQVVGEWLAARDDVDLIVWWTPSEGGPRYSVFSPRAAESARGEHATLLAARQAAVLQVLAGG